MGVIWGYIGVVEGFFGRYMGIMDVVFGKCIVRGGDYHSAGPHFLPLGVQ